MAAPQGTRASLTGLLLIAAAGLVWGTIPIALAATKSAPVISVFARVVIAGAVMAAWMTMTGGWREVFALPRRKVVQLVVQGVILTVNWVLFLTALDLTNVATAELLGYMGPVFVAALAPFVTKERFDTRIVVPMVLALGGIVVILAPQGLAVAGQRQVLGAVLAFCSALTYSVLLLRSKKILHGVTARALMVVEYGVASVLLLPFAVWLFAQGQGPATIGSYVGLATLGVVHTALAGLLFLAGLRRVRTDHAAILTYAEPASAVVFAAIFLAQPLTVPTVVGGLMVVAGGALVARLESREVSMGPESAPAFEGGAPDGHESGDAD
jgi:drug/metabolite transporter (DMT)-like permease